MQVLFKECVEALKAHIVTPEESNALSLLFRKRFQLTDWGRIDWDKIKNKIDIGSDPSQIIPNLANLLGSSFDKSVYIEWSDGDVSIIKTDLDAIVSSFDDVTCVASDIFIFNLHSGYVVEIRRNGDITAGLV